MSNQTTKNMFQKRLFNFFGLHRLIPTQIHLNNSILNNVVKIMKSFILGSMKPEEKTYKVIFPLNCENF